MDKEFVGAEARSRFQTATTPILSPQDLVTYADWIVDELTNIATLTVRAARRAQRQRSSRRTEENWKLAQEAEDEQTRAIRGERRSSWRNAIAQARAGHKSLWARLRSGLPPESRQIPPLLRTVGNNTITANTHEEKAAPLAERFFPHPTARTSDIPQDTALFPREDHFTQEEIKEIIKRLSSWKVESTGARRVPRWIPQGLWPRPHKGSGPPTQQQLSPWIPTVRIWLRNRLRHVILSHP
ncbi:uncharacterized protein CPUR_08593 [Claviceps purpurea 20.1]|uniref:Uncharacterized protein n=1 Tax=Claviceps purpurea (strain 20.1) TaxID=1111077 RepID=M1WGL9_CLAP2|nr:uncharacterized protein CPUR_08593 [Claviceps purpurea 20.1]